MNITVFIVLAPLAAWLFPVYVPPNATTTIYANLPPMCNATGVIQVEKPVYIMCVNTALKPVALRGYVAVEYPVLPPPQASPTPSPIPAVVAGIAAAAGLSYLLSNRREWLAAPILPIAARIKKARALEDPVRREILRVVEQMGAATMSQIAKATGKSWGAVQWHVYVLEREGKLKSIRIGAFTYYFIDPKKAAEVILSSVDPSALPPEDREKLDFLAAAG
ncbi:ArsR/SmtB family transcription factor [Pyrobaculum aerophilum]|uniref:ArsR family transcriptional regulator n=1 Tax=Pyrobaculum aerophilum TaxID=13773 RepID=A0A371R5T3_9CREN|nr:ArsR family transcriptional regulator [Pyrobaculum aerophilum]RFA99413.1 ArsR family transcriptional regulator [Pyrobaculum aerophilum]